MSGGSSKTIKLPEDRIVRKRPRAYQKNVKKKLPQSPAARRHLPSSEPPSPTRKKVTLQNNRRWTKMEKGGVNHVCRQFNGKKEGTNLLRAGVYAVPSCESRGFVPTPKHARYQPTMLRTRGAGFSKRNQERAPTRQKLVILRSLNMGKKKLNLCRSSETTKTPRIVPKEETHLPKIRYPRRS